MKILKKYMMIFNYKDHEILIEMKKNNKKNSIFQNIIYIYNIIKEILHKEFHTWKDAKS